MKKQLVIGITGHRQIHSLFLDQIEQETDAFLKRIKADHIDSHHILQSPLAEGADRLVAKMALHNGFELVVPLPFEKEEYKKDFESEESKLEFEQLCQQATKIFVPELPNFKLRNRDDGYLRVGSYLAQTSHILLSLWDARKDLELKGGTAHIIRCQMEGFPHDLQSELVVADRKTYVIPTARDGNKMPGKVTGYYLTKEMYQSMK